MNKLWAKFNFNFAKWRQEAWNVIKVEWEKISLYACDIFYFLT